MKRSLAIVLVTAVLTTVATTAIGNASRHGGEVSVHKDEIKLAKDFKSAKPISLGKALDARVSLYESDFLDRRVVSAQCDIHNPSDAKVYLSYHAALFDAEGVLLGCTAMTTEVEAHDMTALGLLIELPTDALDRVDSCQVVLYESDHEIGK